MLLQVNLASLAIPGCRGGREPVADCRSSYRKPPAAPQKCGEIGAVIGAAGIV